MLVHVVDDQAAQQGTDEEQNGYGDDEPDPGWTLAFAWCRPGLGLLDIKVCQFDVDKLAVAEFAHVVIDMLLIGRRKVREAGKTSSGRMLDGSAG